MHPPPPPRTDLQPVTNWSSFAVTGTRGWTLMQLMLQSAPWDKAETRSGRDPVFAQPLPRPLLLFSGLPSGNHGHQNPTSVSALGKPDLRHREKFCAWKRFITEL